MKISYPLITKNGIYIFTALLWWNLTAQTQVCSSRPVSGVQAEILDVFVT